MAANRAVVKLAHHEQQELCVTRPTYRQGRKLTAVKVMAYARSFLERISKACILSSASSIVYTVNDESQHLMICGVPKLQLTEEIKKLASPYGDVKKVILIPDYPREEFTEAYHVHYGRIQSARIAKRFIDGKNFYGGLLHVFYAPELETVSETRSKLIQRRRDIAIRIQRNQEDQAKPETDAFVPKEQYHRKKKTPALPLTEDRLRQTHPGESLTSIYHGIPQSIDPRPVPEPSLPQNWPVAQSSETIPTEGIPDAPYQPTDAVLIADEKRRHPIRPKNYKGRYVGQNKNVKLTRPHIIDTRNMPIKVSIPRLNDPEDKKVFTNAKKVETGIKIKLLDNQDKSKKRIVMKNPNTTSLLKSSPDLQTSISLARAQIREAMQRK